MIFNLIIALCMVTCFTLGVYFADVIKRYVYKALYLITGTKSDTMSITITECIKDSDGNIESLKMEYDGAEIEITKYED